MVVFIHYRELSTSPLSVTYQPPDMSLMGREVRMKFKIKETGKIQWFNGQVTTYDGMKGKYGVYFPIDQQTVFVYPDDKDVEFT